MPEAVADPPELEQEAQQAPDEGQQPAGGKPEGKQDSPARDLSKEAAGKATEKAIDTGAKALGPEAEAAWEAAKTARDVLSEKGRKELAKKWKRRLLILIIIICVVFLIISFIVTGGGASALQNQQ